MKRIYLIIVMVLIQIAAFAQRGKVRPEWDLDGGNSVSCHGVDDDMWGFFLMIGIIVLFFIYSAIKGSIERSKTKLSPVSKYDADEDIEDFDDEMYRSSLGICNTKDIAEDLVVDDGEESNEDVTNEWIPYGDSYSLKDIWEAQFLDQDLYSNIDGETADVVCVELANGEKVLRIEIPFKDGTSVQLKLDSGDYEEGEKILIASITGQELRKKGCDPIVRYSGEIILSTAIKKKDLGFMHFWEDEFGVKYGKDRKRLLETPEFKDEYSYSDQWLASMYNIDNLKTLDKIQMDSMQRALLTHDYVKKCKEYKLPPKINDYIVKAGTLVICDNAFTNCSGLIKVELPNSLLRIGENVFAGCDNLESIIIPKGKRKKFEQMLPEYKDKLVERDS